MTAALMAGGREFFGWGQDRHLIADLYDALSLNTSITAVGAQIRKPPQFEPWPRPSKAPEPKSPEEMLRSLHARFMGGAGRAQT